nr:auxilin-like protein 1 [Ipomoea batatas]
MSGVSMGYTRSRPFNGENMLRRCSNNTQADNVILIDDDVIVIDSPEYLHKNVQHPSMQSLANRCPQRTVIFLDDDENFENNENNQSTSGRESDFLNRPSSSQRPFPPCKDATKTPDDNGDDCQFVRENKAPVKLSKCKRTYSGRASSRNRYGLTSDSESSSSDSDSELMVDSVGKLQEEWEKASSRRKYEGHNTQSGVNRFDSTSMADLQAERGQTEEHPASSSLGKASNEKEDMSPFAKGDESSSSSSLRNEDGRNPKDFSSFYENFADDLEMDFQDKGKNQSSDPCVTRPVSQRGVKNFYYTKDSSLGKGDCLREDPCSSGAQDSDDQCIFTEYGSPYPGHLHSMDKFSPCPGQTSSGRNFSPGVGIGTGKCHYQDNGEASLENPSKSCKHLGAEEEIVSSPSKSQQEEKSEYLLHSHGYEDGQNNDSTIITERERLKETDEYKKALEEELASRQRALQIQAEEAQNLRRLLKRKKAEKMRLLDMERRQKQRVDEMRETQKKDEENMNMKEVIRNQVRSELSKLETTCRDMASVLRGLGIFVGSSPFPQSSEVRAAYKKALLTFHPDRASRDDIRQQVEAEEKFKLISRMKEKFFPTL